MGETHSYSVTVKGSKVLLGGIIKIKEKRHSYIFIGRKGVIVAIIPKELSPIIFLEGFPL